VPQVWTYDEERAVIVRIRYAVVAADEDEAIGRLIDRMGEFSVYQACVQEAERAGEVLISTTILGDEPYFELVSVAGETGDAASDG